jgi:flagellar basal body rod protein FlgG
LGWKGSAGWKRASSNPNEGGGVGYTRLGNFFINDHGRIVMDGRELLPEFTVPGGVVEIAITQEGVVEGLVSGKVERELPGQITLYWCNNPERLKRVTDTVFATSEQSGEMREVSPGADGGALMQGFLEESNVSLAAAKARLRYLDRWEAALGH